MISEFSVTEKNIILIIVNQKIRIVMLLVVSFGIRSIERFARFRSLELGECWIWASCVSRATLPRSVLRSVPESRESKWLLICNQTGLFDFNTVVNNPSRVCLFISILYV